jgi:hypothetical protein
MGRVPVFCHVSHPLSVLELGTTSTRTLIGAMTPALATISCGVIPTRRVLNTIWPVPMPECQVATYSSFISATTKSEVH